MIPLITDIVPIRLRLDDDFDDDIDEDDDEDAEDDDEDDEDDDEDEDVETWQVVGIASSAKGWLPLDFGF